MSSAPTPSATRGRSRWPACTSRFQTTCPRPTVGRFKEWTDKTAELPEDAVVRDLLLTNVSVYWFTRSGASAARFIYEGAHGGPDWGAAPTTEPAPQVQAVFGGDELLRRVMDPERKIEHWSQFDRGGHFPAMEVPELLVADVRAFFRRLR